MTPYICDGTIVKTKDDRQGKVVGVDGRLKIAVVYTGKSFLTEFTRNLKVVSYEEVQ